MFKFEHNLLFYDWKKLERKSPKKWVFKVPQVGDQMGYFEWKIDCCYKVRMHHFQLLFYGLIYIYHYNLLQLKIRNLLWLLMWRVIFRSCLGSCFFTIKICVCVFPLVLGGKFWYLIPSFFSFSTLSSFIRHLFPCHIDCSQLIQRNHYNKKVYSKNPFVHMICINLHIVHKRGTYNDFRKWMNLTSLI